MGCKRFSPTPKWAAAWHRLRCTECRAAARADETIARGVAMLRGEQPPADGLAKTLAVLAGMPMPVEEFRPASAQAWKKGLALAGAMGVVAVAIVGYKLNSHGISEKDVKGPFVVTEGPKTDASTDRNADKLEPGMKMAHGDPPDADNGPVPPVRAKDDTIKPRRPVRQPKHRPVRPPKPEVRTASAPPVVMPGKPSDGMRVIEPLPEGMASVPAPKADVTALIPETRGAIVAAYGVDGAGQVRLRFDSSLAVSRRVAASESTAVHLYVIDRLSSTPHEPRVASNPERAKESQVW